MEQRIQHKMLGSTGISSHAQEKGLWPKGERGLGKEESQIIVHKTGSGKVCFFLCTKCGCIGYV